MREYASIKKVLTKEDFLSLTHEQLEEFLGDSYLDRLVANHSVTCFPIKLKNPDEEVQCPLLDLNHLFEYIEDVDINPLIKRLNEDWLVVLNGNTYQSSQLIDAIWMALVGENFSGDY